MNIDKDIEIIKKLLTWTGYETTIREYEAQAIENVLSELETYKKIAKRLAKEILLQYPEMFNMVTVNNIEMVIDEARKEVEK